MTGNRSLHHHARPAGSVDGGRHHRLRSRQRGTDTPDLAAAAREAVVGFLHDSSMGSPSHGTTQPAGAMITPEGAATAVAVKVATDHADVGIPAAMRVRIPVSMTPGATGAAAESVAVRAAAAGVATLDRIEAAAAKVEADIRAALRAQAELQAGAGVAAEAAVRAAQEAWIAARASEAAEGRARVILGVMTRYLAVTIALVVVTVIFLVITAGVVH
jgi:hypothetical protein